MCLAFVSTAFFSMPERALAGFPHAPVCDPGQLQKCPPNVFHGTTMSPEAAEAGRLSRLLAENTDPSRRVRLLIERGESYRIQGRLWEAREDFSLALDEAASLHAPVPEIIAMHSLGYVLFLQQEHREAVQLLRRALERAESLDPSAPLPAASCANRLGNMLLHFERKDEAAMLYSRALEHLGKAQSPGDPAMEAAIHRNLARTAPDNAQAFAHLTKALQCMDRIVSPRERVQLLLAIEAEAHSWDPEPSGDAFRHQALQQAMSTAQALEPPHPRLLSLAYGKMGALYESRGRMDEARTLTEQAIAVSGTESFQGNGLLLQWEGQLARIFKELNDRPRAMAAYGRALFHADAVRRDIPHGFEGEAGTISAMGLAAIYRGLADLLLEQSGFEQDEGERRKLLEAARQAVESGKQSELRDYFRDPCIAARTREIKELSPTTAVIYPVVLDDRLEVLAEMGGVLHRRTLPIPRATVEAVLGRLAVGLRNIGSYEAQAREVYSWLIEPLEALLDENAVDTLIFVPDGAFRTIPMAALWDGNNFLITHYAVVTQPGLTLFDPGPLPRGNLTALMAGMSEPGPVVMHLPKSLWDSLVRIDLAQYTRSIRGHSITVDALRHLDDLWEVEARGSTPGDRSQAGAPTPDQDEQLRAMQRHADHVKEVLKLPGVEQEMEQVSANLKGELLMNDRFLLDTFAGRLQGGDYRVVHIASHGFFGGSSEENFIMAYDNILGIDQMEDLIRTKQFAARPVELIALSACQTAEGDDRTPLGIAGVALKSGARSVLGSLWPVSDSATQELFTNFYNYLRDETFSKAQALQQAQAALIRDPEHRHPFFWAAFIIVGNWL